MAKCKLTTGTCNCLLLTQIVLLPLTASSLCPTTSLSCMTKLGENGFDKYDNQQWCPSRAGRASDWSRWVDKRNRKNRARAGGLGTALKNSLNCSAGTGCHFVMCKWLTAKGFKCAGIQQ